MNREVYISVIIPAYNEGATIADVIRKIPRDKLPPHEIIVIDGGSKDDTVEKAKSSGAKVIIEKRRGYGRAVRTGFRIAKGKIFILVDADDTYNVTDIPKLIKLIEAGADIVLASRFKGGIYPNAMPIINIVGNLLLTLLYNILYGQWLTDTQTGFRAFNRKSLSKLKLKENHFPFATELLTQAAKKGLKITEVPSPYYRRRGETKLRPLRDGIKIMSLLFKQLFVG